MIGPKILEFTRLHQDNFDKGLVTIRVPVVLLRIPDIFTKGFPVADRLQNLVGKLQMINVHVPI